MNCTNSTHVCKKRGLMRDTAAGSFWERQSSRWLPIYLDTSRVGVVSESWEISHESFGSWDTSHCCYYINPVLWFPKTLKEKHWQSNQKLTFTIVLLCLIKVWKPSHLIFMESSKTTTINANSSRVAWTCHNTAKLKPALLVTNSSTEATFLLGLFKKQAGLTTVWAQLCETPRSLLKPAQHSIFQSFCIYCFALLLKPIESSSVQYQPRISWKSMSLLDLNNISKKCIETFETKGQDSNKSSKTLFKKYETVIFLVRHRKKSC